MSMMEYNGYYGTVSYDDEAGICFGRVNNLPKDGVTFEGKSIEALRTAFRESVDGCLA
jgi:predicted HicB family RNase H-like nuclease